jgi:hypothetical protein
MGFAQLVEGIHYETRVARVVHVVGDPEPDLTSDGVTYAWRGAAGDAELVELTTAHGGRAEAGSWDRVRPHRLGYCAGGRRHARRVRERRLGRRDHALLLDTKTHGLYQRRRIGTSVVCVAAEHARAAGCEWLHVDFVAELAAFYLDTCGFRPAEAGLIQLPSLGDP